MRAVPAEQARIVDAFKKAETDPPEFAPLLDPFQYTASANYVVPMLVDLAIRKGNELVDLAPRYSSLDHSIIWNDLLAGLARFEDFAIPYFNHALVADPFAEELLAYEHAKIARRHVISSFEQKMWTLVDDGSGLRIRLAEPMRRSALHLVANKARHLRSPEPVRAVLTNPDARSRDLALVSGVADLAVFAESAPAAWQGLTSALPFPTDALPGFRAFVLTLGGLSDRHWFHANELWDVWMDFAADSGLEQYTEDVFRGLLEFHSLTVEEAQSWGTQAAFLRFDETYAAWFFVFHVLPPDLHFLVLLARRYEALWSQTLGAHLDLVADWLGAQLCAGDRVRWAARRRRRGIGEADLILLDDQTGAVLVLELKTVFDKFRTHLQMRNFTEQKVNFPKALAQARAASAAIEAGNWRLKEIFGKDAPSQSTSVTPGVLTWWDTYNPTLGSGDQVLCCNFDTLLFVLEEAEGDVNATVGAISELARVYCPGVLDVTHATVEGDPLELRREVQGDHLPPGHRLRELNLGELAQRLIDDLPQWPNEDARGKTDDGLDRFVY